MKRQMKTIITGFGSILILVFTMVIQSNVINYTSRANELNNAVNNAVVDTQRVIYDERYKINNSKEYIAEFTQNLLQYINSNSNIKIKVYSADEETGILDIGVVSEYQNLKFEGNDKKTYEVRRTSIIDSIKTEHADIQDSYFITFQIGPNVKVNLEGINFFVPKSTGITSYKIPIKSGNISSVDFNGSVEGSYRTATENGQKYIILDLKNVKSDTVVKIN